MLKKLLNKLSSKLRSRFSIETKPGAFFRRIDWTAFWGATLISFLVYFFTLGPSVGLEDSGELATAADHLGVPHPPGYPFWTLCCWFFCRVFSWVHYMGQPTPAWAVSLFSAVAGAFAAGCTAMLICRSGSDMLDSMDSNAKDAQERVPPEGSAQRHALMGFAGGLGGALVFAFSPVEWSQSTIVEIYSLNALFLMAVFLLSYRWMRKPSDKILWLTAFVFGLGLTNYQVLLMAAVPLAIIILLKDIRLFRDFTLILIPVALTAQVLQIGSKQRATSTMGADVINKFTPITEVTNCPNEILLWLGFALVAAAPIVGKVLVARKQRHDMVLRGILFTGGAGLFFILLASTVFAGKATWAIPDYAPLISPAKYAWIALFLAATCVLSLCAAFAPEDATLSDRRVWQWLAGAGFCAFVALSIASEMKTAGNDGFMGEEFSWVKPTLVLFVGIALLIGLSLLTPRKRGLAFALPVASVQFVVFVLLSKGAMNGLTHPTTWWFFWPCIWNFVMLGLAVVALPNGRAIGLAMLFAELGVSFYAYMPIVSDLRNPPMNWGYPRTWDGFKHAILRGQYEAIKMPSLGSMEGLKLFCKQMGFYFQDLRMQFTLVAAALALIPFALWKGFVKTKQKLVKVPAAHIAVGLYIATAALVIVFSELFESWTDGEVPGRLDKFLLLAMALLAFVGIGAMFVRQARVIIRQIRGRDLKFGADAKIRVHFLADDVTQQWLIAVGSCFAIMSFFLVALANVKGDIQDGFIQKVKFISSHGMFSLWIGYGLVVGLVIANRLVSRFIANTRLRRIMFGVLCVLAGSIGAIPIYENYTNDKLVFAMGAAEQNGHTFGWQFGNYQLRGANAIREELSPDEEPLPNPLWPEEMEPSAIFFGGTDPGRFVPTYMIYSAVVRPDVYLITQNALADDTYMSVMRDLYGDEIWIPAKLDSAAAFEEYVTSMSPEERAAKGVVTENGRVQVTGALSVMDINGILTKMMFDHERLRHAFYVEESYVIQWMYDYLTPHGLIMKINSDKSPLNDAIARNDMEFWDWYTRRLLRDPAFRRDFAAQKSFSKLRAAIAGLYAKVGRSELNKTRDEFLKTQSELQRATNEQKKMELEPKLQELNQKFTQLNQTIQKCSPLAAPAFREAVALYPASPEAAFRYLQDDLLVRGKWDAMLDMLSYIDRVDPNNGRTTFLSKSVGIACNASRTLNAILSSHGAADMRNILNSPMPTNVVSNLTRDEADSLFDARLDYAEVLMNIGGFPSLSIDYALKESEGKLSSSFKRIWRAATLLHRLDSPQSAIQSARCAESVLNSPDANSADVWNVAADIFGNAYLAYIPEADKKALAEDMKAKCFDAIKRAMQFPESQTFETLTHYASIFLKLDQKKSAESLILQQALKLKNAKTSLASLIEASRILAKTNLDNNRGQIQLYLMKDIRARIRRNNYTKQEAVAFSELMKELGNAPAGVQGVGQPAFTPAL